MTTEEAIKFANYAPTLSKEPEVQEFYRMCEEALRAQQDWENPKPLTLDELREMDGEPVWCEWLLPEDRTEETGGWFIVVKTKQYPWFEIKRPLDFGSHVCKIQNYGSGWIAYRSGPKEGSKC